MPHPPTITLIAALSENHTIGVDGTLPWRLSADLKHFKQLTTGHPIVMGRKTFESIGKPLPNRRNIVLTRDPHWQHDGVEVAHDLDEAIARCADEDEVFIIGGEQIYHLALPQAQRMYLTHVHAHVVGDATFPDFDPNAWTVTDEAHHPADDRNDHPMTFRQYDRR